MSLPCYSGTNQVGVLFQVVIQFLETGKAPRGNPVFVLFGDSNGIAPFVDFNAGKHTAVQRHSGGKIYT